MTTADTTPADLPREYARLTLRDLLMFYDGRSALECPPELAGWLEVARDLDALISSRRAQRAGPVLSMKGSA